MKKVLLQMKYGMLDEYEVVSNRIMEESKWDKIKKLLNKIDSCYDCEPREYAECFDCEMLKDRYACEHNESIGIQLNSGYGNIDNEFINISDFLKMVEVINIGNTPIKLIEKIAVSTCDTLYYLEDILSEMIEDNNLPTGLITEEDLELIKNM